VSAGTGAAGGLRFGTAGLRAPMGPGPDRMNRDTVRRASAGLSAWVRERHGAGGSIVVGHDARHRSATFAADAAAAIAGAGLRGRRIDGAVPTPVLAFAVRELGAAAGVMITASHNPATDNGLKVYAADGAQIIAPADAEISARIDAAPPAGALPAGEAEPVAADELVTRYLEAIVPAALRHAPPARALDLVYTPVHGVGRAVMLAALHRAGFEVPRVVAAQADPDPDFPTAPRPNPEEPGVLDLALAEARSAGADLVLANDPDADRLAVAVPWRGEGGEDGWRRLTGDEVGGLLADELLRGSAAAGEDPGRQLLVSTVVSASLLGRLAQAAGARHVETLTGFKWIMRAVERTDGASLLLGYEQALGYAVTDRVRDKDGISAALAVAAIAAAARAAGTTVQARLDALAERVGLHATAERDLDLRDGRGADRARAALVRLRDAPPPTLLGEPVTAVDDLARSERRGPGGTRSPLGLPSAEGIILHAGDRVRLAVRPSGTEPKMKLYLQVVLPVPAGGAAAARRQAATALGRLAAEAEGLMGR
jgi:phosphomannomutase